MRYAGPALLHLTEDEVHDVVKHLPQGAGGSLGLTLARMRAWLTYRETTRTLHGEGREVSWNPQTRSHDA